MKSMGHSFSVVFVSKPSKLNCVSVGIKVSPAIRSTLFESMSGFVFMCGKRIKVEDRFHVKQCFHCQLLGHMSTECPTKMNAPTCLYCMGPHRSTSCSYKNVKCRHACAKCAASNNVNDVTGHETHNSASLDCPMYLRECKRLASMTDISSKNVL